MPYTFLLLLSSSTWEEGQKPEMVLNEYLVSPLNEARLFEEEVCVGV